MSSEIKDTNSPKAVAQFIAETKEADPELYAQAMREVEEQEQAETSKATLGDDLRSLADSANLSILDGYAKQADAQDAEIERLLAEIEQLRKPAPTLASLIRRERAGDDRSYD